MRIKKLICFCLTVLIAFQIMTVSAEPYINVNIPGSIEAENYDIDGKGISYGDVDLTNLGGLYRQDDVDIYSANSGKLHYVLMEQNEWLKYTFYTDRAGSFDIYLNAIIDNLKSKANLYIDDMLVLEKKELSATTKDTFTDIYIGAVYLKEGEHTLTLENKSYDIKLNSINFLHTRNKGVKTWDMQVVKLSVPPMIKKGSNLGFPQINFRGGNETEEVYQTVIYVSENGNDGNDGSENKPFKTIKRAKEEVRKYSQNMTGNVKVSIGAGRYYTYEPIVFDMADSATNGFSIIYEGSENDDTFIDGGIPVTNFKKVPGKPLWEADFDKDGFMYEFYVNDHRARVAQSEYNYMPRSGARDPETNAIRGLKFNNTTMPLKFENPDGMILWACNEWKPSFYQVDQMICDEETTSFLLKGEHFSLQSSLMTGCDEILFKNHISLLDKPGEFYYDKEAKKIYYYPLENEDMSKAVGYVPATKQLVDIAGEGMEKKIKGLTFRNLNFRHTVWEDDYITGHYAGQGDQYFTGKEKNWYDHWGNINASSVTANYAENVNITDCSFENLSAIAVHFNHGVENCDIIGNTFYDVGAAAVVLGNGFHCDVAKQAKLIPKYVNIDNNLVRECGQIYSGSCGIQVFYANNTSVSNNDLAYLPYSGISFGWGWGNATAECRDNRICNNKVNNVMHTAWDGSSIYTLSKSEGTIISGNYMLRTETEFGGGGYYNDEGSAEYTVVNNVFDNARTWNVQWGNLPNAPATISAKATNKYKNNYVTRLKKEGHRGDNPTQEQLAGFIEVGEGNEWPEEAKIIMRNAGLRGQYKELLAKFESRDIPENMFCYRQRVYYDPKEYIVIEPGRDFIKGEEGVTYHDSDPFNDSDGFENGPDFGGKNWNIGYNGAEDLEWMTFKLKTDKAGYYDVLLGGATMNEGSCRLSLDGEVVLEEGLIKPSGNWNKIAINNLGEIYLDANKEYILKFEFRSGATNFSHLGFALKSDEVFLVDAQYDSLTE